MSTNRIRNGLILCAMALLHVSSCIILLIGHQRFDMQSPAQRLETRMVLEAESFSVGLAPKLELSGLEAFFFVLLGEITWKFYKHNFNVGV